MNETKLHTIEEFNSAYAGTLCQQANGWLTQWRQRQDTSETTWAMARREYAEAIQVCHVNGLAGALEPMDWFALDVVKVYTRAAARTKNRPRQCRIALLRNPKMLIDVSPTLGDIILSGIEQRYRGYVKLDGDKERDAKWCWHDVKGNNYGRLLAQYPLETAVDDSSHTLNEPRCAWAIS